MGTSFKKMRYYLPTLIFLIFSSSLLHGQTNVSGNYHNYFGRKLILNSDSTYNYSYHFDLGSSWSYGKWIIKNDTVYLSNIVVYDTTSYQDTLKDGNIAQKTEVLLSSDDKPDSISQGETFINLIYGGQNRLPYPEKLFFKRNRIYDFKINGRLNHKRIQGFMTSKKYAPYYVKK